jgi:hypothetical protein
MSLVTQNYTGTKLQPFMDPEEALVDSVPFGNSLTVAQGTVVAVKTADGKWYAYANGNADGTEVARGIAVYAFTTDGSGKVTIASDKSVVYDGAPVYLAGTFRTTELTGLDAPGVVDLGRIVEGQLADGVLRVT